MCCLLIVLFDLRLQPMEVSGNLSIPWIWEQPLLLDVKLMGKLRPSKQFA